jgi:gamma-D-glutamyl-L-lysine dipeptidyl-peptidase
MEYAICLQAIVQLRDLPDEKSELVSQLLFGETVRVFEKKGNWLFVEVIHDRYQGWVFAGQVKIIDEDFHTKLLGSPRWINKDLVQVLENRTKNSSMLVSAGSTFYNCVNNEFELFGDKFIYHGSLAEIKDYHYNNLASNALLFLNTPYLWGGRSALGIDCSGFTQVVFKMSGKAIQRDASQQAGDGEIINLINEAHSGDLAFFDNENEEIIHVGLLLDGENIIHAHNQVRIDKIDHQGIFNTDIKKYSHNLRLIKRV